MTSRARFLSLITVTLLSFSFLPAVLLLAPTARAKSTANSAIPDTSPLKVDQVVFTPQTPKPGQIVQVAIEFHIATGYHAYVRQFRLKLANNKTLKLSKLHVQPTYVFMDPVTHRPRLAAKNRAQIISLLDLPPNISGGSLPLDMQLTYQACGPKFCLFPKTIPVKASLSIAGAQNSFTRALAKGWFYALIIVFFAGILTSFTPCIFPMIPITLAILGTKDSGKRQSKAFLLSLFYVLGIAITYAILGLIAAKTGAMFGSLLGRPLVVGVIAALFVLMGLSMYGLFEVRLPAALTNLLTRSNPSNASVSERRGLVTAFASGLVAGVVASPCVGPVLISVLAYVAQKQNPVAGFFLLFTFALGFGQLFLLIGTFQSLWQKLPRSGPWMEQVKILFGTVMIAMAFYYIRPVTSPLLFNSLAAVALVAIAVFFGALSRSKGSRVQRYTARVLLVLGVIFALKASAPFWSPVHFNPGHTTAVALGPKWAMYSGAHLEKAAAAHKPVIVDFRADWCLACAELAKYTFTNPAVLKLGRSFVWLKFDATSPSPELNRLQKKYDIAGLPYVLFFAKDGRWERNLTVTGYEDPPQFLRHMKTALRAK